MSTRWHLNQAWVKCAIALNFLFAIILIFSSMEIFSAEYLEIAHFLLGISLGVIYIFLGLSIINRRKSLQLKLFIPIAFYIFFAAVATWYCSSSGEHITRGSDYITFCGQGLMKFKHYMLFSIPLFALFVFTWIPLKMNRFYFNKQ